jgi:predicted dinucleotide-binding enzyme
MPTPWHLDVSERNAPGVGGLPFAMTLTIAVVGTGNIGGTLGRAFAAAGHTVVLGSRHPTDGADPREAPIAEALDGADVVVLALPGNAVPAFVQEHAAALAGPLVVDASNNLGGGSANAHDALTAAVPGLRYARAFNTLGWENFADPLPGSALFFAADDGARAAAEELIAAVGLEPACLGGPGAAGTVDALLPVWFTLVQHNGGNRRLALRVLR